MGEHRFVRGAGATLAVALGTATIFGNTRDANAFAYIFAGEANGIDIVTHSLGYTGAGGAISISVGIDPTSSFAAQMLIPTQNAVNTWNDKLPTTGNVNSTGVGAGQFDYESTVLHELGHALGLSHVNAASESGLGGANQNYTKATDGANNVFDINPGSDGIIGSGDDIRGDDVNLNYFRYGSGTATDNNNPFASLPLVVDSTTYSRDLANLPGTDTYSANGDRAVAAALGFTDTEAVMQQGTFSGETQRSLTADDVAGLLYAQSGVDEIAGTADDYIVTLDFLGLTSGADIVIDFDNAQTSFAVTQSSGAFLSGDHVVVTSSSIFFNSGFNWFFNTESNEIPAPGTLVFFAAGLAFIGYRRRVRTAA
jgi:hypothetical protein